MAFYGNIFLQAKSERKGCTNMKTIRAVIADNDEAYRLRLRNFMGAYGISCVGEAADGESAVEVIMSEKPDVVVTDLLLSHRDGAGVIHDVKRLLGESSPVFLVVASVGTKDMISDALECGARYCVVKPASAKSICSKIIKLSGKSSELNLDGHTEVLPTVRRISDPVDRTEAVEREATEIIRKVGVSANRKGYGYLRRAVVFSESDGGMSRYSTDIYPRIARQFSATATGVERAIGHSLESAWSGEKTENFLEVCERLHLSPYRKPKNSEFIAAVADVVAMRVNSRMR